MSSSFEHKPVIGISCGDINGIGIELIIKSLTDTRLLEVCTPVVFASNKAINFYRKSIPEFNFNYQNSKELNRVNAKQVTVFNCWKRKLPSIPAP